MLVKRRTISSTKVVAGLQIRTTFGTSELPLLFLYPWFTYSYAHERCQPPLTSRPVNVNRTFRNIVRSYASITAGKHNAQANGRGGNGIGPPISRGKLEARSYGRQTYKPKGYRHEISTSTSRTGISDLEQATTASAPAVTATYRTTHSTPERSTRTNSGFEPVSSFGTVRHVGQVQDKGISRGSGRERPVFKRHTNGISYSLHEDSLSSRLDWQPILELLLQHTSPQVSSHHLPPIEMSEADLSRYSGKLEENGFNQPTRKPQFSSPDEVEAYIAALPDLHRSTGAKTSLSGIAFSLKHGLVKDILSIFSDPENRDFLTVRVFNAAFKILARHSQDAAIRQLFNHMNLLQVRPDTYTFTFCAMPSIRSGDFHHFEMTLRMMIERQMQPNLFTWASFLPLLRCTEAKEEVIGHMKKFGLVHHQLPLQMAVEHIIGPRFQAFLSQRDAAFDSFLKSLDDEFGQKWPSGPATNRLLRIACEQGSHDMIWEIIHTMHRRGLDLTTRSLDRILVLAIRQNDPAMAAKALSVFRDLWDVPFDGPTFILLFKLAWRCRLYNLGRVVWTYACLTGDVGYEMKCLIARSLDIAEISPFPTHGEVWRASAARVMAGIGQGNELISDLRGSRDASSGQLATSSTSRHTLIRHDLAASKVWQAKLPMNDAVQAALKADAEWVDGLGRSEVPLSLKREKAVDYPIIPREPGAGSDGRP